MFFFRYLILIFYRQFLICNHSLGKKCFFFWNNWEKVGNSEMGFEWLKLNELLKGFSFILILFKFIVLNNVRNADATYTYFSECGIVC